MEQIICLRKRLVIKMNKFDINKDRGVINISENRRLYYII